MYGGLGQVLPRAWFGVVRVYTSSLALTMSRYFGGLFVDSKQGNDEAIEN